MLGYLVLAQGHNAVQQHNHDENVSHRGCPLVLQRRQNKNNVRKCAQPQILPNCESDVTVLTEHSKHSFILKFLEANLALVSACTASMAVQPA